MRLTVPEDHKVCKCISKPFVRCDVLCLWLGDERGGEAPSGPLVLHAACGRCAKTSFQRERQLSPTTLPGCLLRPSEHQIDLLPCAIELLRERSLIPAAWSLYVPLTPLERVFAAEQRQYVISSRSSQRRLPPANPRRHACNSLAQNH